MHYSYEIIAIVHASFPKFQNLSLSLPVHEHSKRPHGAHRNEATHPSCRGSGGSSQVKTMSLNSRWKSRGPQPMG